MKRLISSVILISFAWLDLAALVRVSVRFINSTDWHASLLATKINYYHELSQEIPPKTIAQDSVGRNVWNLDELYSIKIYTPSQHQGYISRIEPITIYKKDFESFLRYSAVEIILNARIDAWGKYWWTYAIRKQSGAKELPAAPRKLIRGVDYLTGEPLNQDPDKIFVLHDAKGKPTTRYNKTSAQLLLRYIVAVDPSDPATRNPITVQDRKMLADILKIPDMELDAGSMAYQQCGLACLGRDIRFMKKSLPSLSPDSARYKEFEATIEKNNNEIVGRLRKYRLQPFTVD